MFGFLIRRTFTLLLTVLGAVVLLFLIIRLIPGDPAIAMLGNRATPGLIASIREQMLLDEPVYIQLWSFLTGVLQGDLGRRSEEHTSELQSRGHLVCRLLLEKKKKTKHR